MIKNKVDFQATTTAVLEGFSHGFADMVIQLLEQRNQVLATRDKKKGAFVDIGAGNGLLVMAHYRDDGEPFTMTTEFLVPSNDLAASFMVMWRRWCDKRGISSTNGLLSLINRAIGLQTRIGDNRQSANNTNLALGLMGAVLDNYPEIIDSMRWSVDNGFAPCLVIANDNNQPKCGVCYGGKYRV